MLCHCVECHYAECRYAACSYADCRGAALSMIVHGQTLANRTKPGPNLQV